VAHIEIITKRKSEQREEEEKKGKMTPKPIGHVSSSSVD
jgi:hypothetical protein